MCRHYTGGDRKKGLICIIIDRFLQATGAGEYRDESREKLFEDSTGLTEAMDSNGPCFPGDQASAADIDPIPIAWRIRVPLGA